MPLNAGIRLSQLCVALNLTTPDFARLTGTSQRRIDNLFSGRGRPSLKLLAHVLWLFPSLDPFWLLLGEGPIFRALPNSPPGNHLAVNFGNNVQVINLPCNCTCTLDLLKYLHEKEQALNLPPSQLPPHSTY